MPKIEEAITERSIIVWAYRNRQIRSGGDWAPYTITNYPFLKGIFHALQDPETDKVVIQKGTQIGATEAAITSAFYFLDTKAENVLYMLPNQGQLGDFAHSRLNKCIEHSPYLDNLFNDISNVGLKVSSRGSFYLRGANSPQQLEEFPAGFVIRDELSRMDQENASLALKRLGSSQNAWKLDLGHPTYEGDAISSEYANSTRFKWVYKCSNCGEVQPISFFDNYYKRDKELGCRACSETFTKEDLVGNGFFQAQGDEENPVKGFHISRMLSPVEDLDDLAREYEEAKAEGSHKLAQFHNTVLGQPFSIEGDKLGVKDVKNAMRGEPMGTVDARRTIMGVDTGKPLYWGVIKGHKVLGVGRATKFDQLNTIMDKYNVGTVLFDAQPEMHAVEHFIDNLSRDRQGFMVRTKGSGNITSPTVNENEVKAHQTWMFDELFSKFHDGSMVLPQDLPGEAVEHLTNPVRLVEKDAKGNPKPSYEKGESHFADALKFCFVGNHIQGVVPSPTRERIFNNFNPEEDVVRQIPQLDPLVVGIKIGRKTPSAFLLMGISAKGRVYVAREWYRDEETAFTNLEYYDALIEWLKGLNPQFRAGAGPSYLQPWWLFVNDKAFLTSVRERKQHDLRFAPGGTDQVQGIERIQTLLGKNNFLIYKGCKNLISELEGLRWEMSKEEPVKENLHVLQAAIDAVNGVFHSRYRRRVNRNLTGQRTKVRSSRSSEWHF